VSVQQSTALLLVSVPHNIFNELCLLLTYIFLLLLLSGGLCLFDSDVDVDVLCLLFDEWDVDVVAPIKYNVSTSSHFGSVLLLLFSNALSAVVLLEKKRDNSLASRTILLILSLPAMLQVSAYHIHVNINSKNKFQQEHLTFFFIQLF